MSVHLHFGIAAAHPERGPATLSLASQPIEAGDGHPEIALPPTMGAGRAVGALFVDRGSWQVWGEPPDDADPHDTLHVVAELPGAPSADLAAQVRWHLLDGIRRGAGSRTSRSSPTRRTGRPSTALTSSTDPTTDRAT